ncbi:MAG TPA: hypothetical protein VGN32_13000 [Ktedonobacterales bacterium]|nr:hypothetical protein [Ktedonobacterales bacterium]
MIDDFLRESSVVQGWIDEGKHQMAHEMAQAALEGRFGTLSEDLIAALGSADEATLRAVVMHVSTDSLEQVKSRLALS